MARPKKWRKVCCLPQNSNFGPLDNKVSEKSNIIMEVDEYETIRLIDLEGLTQEECSQQMNIARTTVQRIYSSARKKLAQSLVEGKSLQIEGGNYKRCNGTGKTCKSNNCGKKRNRKRF